MSLHGQSSLGCLKRPNKLPLLRRFYSCCRTVKEYDVLFLRQHGPKHAKWHLTAPLRSGARVRLSYGASVPASDLIGRRLLDIVRDSSNNSVVLHEPTLASYIVNSERLATPIYPHDATTIVSLLDINPSRPGEDDEDDHNAPPFEIFEAGTGMGSLTMHIARTIYAANPTFPLLSDICSPPHPTNPTTTSPPQEAALTSLQTSNHARAAYKLIRNFRRAQYLSPIDFHVGSVEEYLGRRLEESGGKPFLSRVILDLPSAHDNAERVVQALHPNGLLILFNPSISQIAEFQTWSNETLQPIRLEKVIELHATTVSDGGVHDSAGGRHWDVKTVVPKAEQGEDGNGKPVQVMRPKVGERVAGGGFVAVLRRWPDTLEQKQEITEETESQEE
ncbi:tRNA (adenine(58)-N(1))-methyltransferase TrmI-like protein [Cladobotryum mycophilum]|uniref:tRNA (adenine(58)-N(1))-methyltransferase catalytic subunit TRM61 n=1 Tax=Cladobotryum mycophilum TaxID=491253 RepID=A0ABR0SUP5_9HYPO